jgi:hypothetical protein
VYIGSYGISSELAAEVHGLPAGVYAPMFHIQPGWFWEQRRLPPGAQRKVAAQHPRSSGLEGPLPALPALLRLPSATRLTWSIELGRRFRDALRESDVADSWQLDEVVAECAGSQGRQYRELIRGALRGLTYGRPALGDGPFRGFVWWAKTAQSLATQRVTPELAAFWRMLNSSCIGLVGEEYPVFAGDPAAAARAAAGGQRGLAHGGPVRRTLSRKYFAGIQPGFRLAPGLGGNTHRLPRAQAERWRAAYVRARASEGVAGVAVFDFRFENSPAPIVRELVRELAAL